jgi:hypothetical protein
LLDRLKYLEEKHNVLLGSGEGQPPHLDHPLRGRRVRGGREPAAGLR